MEKLIEQGIRLKHYSIGNQKVTCPKCSHARRNKTEPCLSVTIKGDGAVWKCHHCEWFGGVGDGSQKTEYKNYKKPQTPINQELPNGSIEWFAKRAISKTTIEQFGIFRTEQSFGNGSEGVIAFPYHKDGELVNVKYRTKDKKFRQEKDAERTLFNIDRLKSYWENSEIKDVIFVEGEMDVLSLYEVGFKNVVSLPDGASKNARFDEADKRFEALKNCTWINDADKVLVFTDEDEAGKALQQELVYRFGKDRCSLVPMSKGCKDANDILVTQGSDVLKRCIELAEPFPIDGVFTAKNYEREVFDIYDGNIQKPVSTGFKNLDQYYKVMPSTFTVVTGVPNHGKSNFIDQLMVNLARNEGWKFAIFSPEHSTPNHIRRLAEKVVGQPFDLGPTERMSKDTLREALKFLDKHFHFIECKDNIPSIDWLLQKAKASCVQFGVKGVLFDPYNEIDSKRDGNKREDEHIRDLISNCKSFCRTHNVAMWMVAHPSKMQRNQDGVIPEPSLYDVSGSAHWNNMCDVGIVVHRDFENNETKVITRKVREQGLYGSIGQCFFTYNLASHVYEEIDSIEPVNYWNEHN